MKSKYIETPEMLLELFKTYKMEIKDNPLKIQDYVGKEGREVYRRKERPLTMVGFETFCASKSLINDLANYFANTNNAYSNYQTICKQIKNAIAADQIEGGMVGIYNHSITSRLNGLVDNKVIANVEQPLFPDVK